MDIETIYETAYLPDKRARRAPSTVAGYDSAMRLHVLPRWGGMAPGEIDPDDVQEWVDAFERPGAAEKALKCLRQVIRWHARRERAPLADPTAHVELPRKPPYAPDVLDARETAEMLRAMWGHPSEPAVLLAATLGLRRGEACGAEWGDVDLRTGEVRVRRSRQTVGGETVCVPVKTERSARSCWLPRFARTRMRQLGRGRSGPVCGDVPPGRVARAYERRCREAGVRFVSMTNLRHTWATLAVEAGVGIETVALMLGHAEIGTAYEHYIRPRASICKEAQAAVEKLIMRSAE